MCCLVMLKLIKIFDYINDENIEFKKQLHQYT